MQAQIQIGKREGKDGIGTTEREIEKRQKNENTKIQKNHLRPCGLSVVRHCIML